MRPASKIFCKICKKKHCAKGFCKSHYGAYVRGLFDILGNLKDGYFLDSNFHIKKKKDSLRQTIRESNWYRQWISAVRKRDKYRCVNCGSKNIKLVTHHKKESFSNILTKARKKFNSFPEQVEFCKKYHKTNIGITLCRECHAKEHFGEKIYSLLVDKNKIDKCIICGQKTYCKGFCHYHYGQFGTKAIDERGNRLREPRLHTEKGICIVCGLESQSRGDIGFKFCGRHMQQYYKKIIDLNGKQLRPLKFLRGAIDKCKVCGEKHFSKSFCVTHYNRFKIGQIDFNGKELRPLGIFDKRGLKSPKIYFEFKGEKLSLEDCAKIAGVHKKTMQKRIKNWGIERALLTPRNEKYARTR